MKIFEKSRFISDYFNGIIKILDFFYSKSGSNLIWSKLKNNDFFFN